MSIPYTDGEHPGETLKARLPPDAVGSEDDLGIGFGLERVSQGNEFITESFVVVDFTVKNDAEGFVPVVDRLRSCL